MDHFWISTAWSLDQKRSGSPTPPPPFPCLLELTHVTTHVATCWSLEEFNMEHGSGALLGQNGQVAANGLLLLVASVGDHEPWRYGVLVTWFA